MLHQNGRKLFTRPIRPFHLQHGRFARIIQVRTINRSSLRPHIEAAEQDVILQLLCTYVCLLYLLPPIPGHGWELPPHRLELLFHTQDIDLVTLTGIETSTDRVNKCVTWNLKYCLQIQS